VIRAVATPVGMNLAGDATGGRAGGVRKAVEEWRAAPGSGRRLVSQWSDPDLQRWPGRIFRKPIDGFRDS
jgi:hypothetical protein